MNWSAFQDPEVWVILGRIAWNVLKIVVILFELWLLFMAVWHGWKVEIGVPDSGFHIHFEQYPLKRFFQ